MTEVAVATTALPDATTADSIMHESGSIFNRITADMVEILIYMICLTIGGPLNVFSCYRLIQSYRQRISSQINLLRINLNIADLLTLFVFVLSQIIWMTTYQWYGGDLLCRVCKFFHTFSFYLNSFVVACIAIDRVFGTYNLSSVKASRLAQRRCRRMLSVAWVCAFIFSLPQVFIFRVFHPPEMRNFKQCTPIWTVVAYEVELALKNGNMSHAEENNLIAEYYQMVRIEKIYSGFHLMFMFWLPAFIIICSYAAIIYILNSLTEAPTATQRTGEKRSWKSYAASCCGLELTAKDGGSRYSFHEKGSLGPQSQLAPFPVEGLISLSESQFDTSLLTSESQHLHQASVEPVHPRLPSEKENDESCVNSAVGSRGTSLKRSENSTRTKMGPLALQTITRARQAAKRQGALILLAYLTFWSPYNLLAVVNAFASEGQSREFASVTLTFLNSLLVVNSCVNPIIYAMKP